LLAQAALLLQAPPSGWPAQAPLLQVCPLTQAMPHPPQLLASVLVLTSQPSAGLPLQSLKPELQDWMPQTPCWQPAVSLLVRHTLPQAPQLLGSVASFTHKVPPLPVQYDCPAEQTTEQLPAVQVFPAGQT